MLGEPDYELTAATLIKGGGSKADFLSILLYGYQLQF